MISDKIRERAQEVVEAASRRGVLIATAESCTGGGIAHALTAIAGSSAVFDRAFVTYSNEAKLDLLRVSVNSLTEYGAVSEAVALEMAQGAKRASTARLTVSTTGIAGPDGGSEDKPVGLVWFAVAAPGRTLWARPAQFEDDGREAIRDAAIAFALDLLMEALEAM